MHPVAGLHESVVQTLTSSQFTGVPLHAPPEQTLKNVRLEVELGITLLLVFVQPVAGLQASVVQRLPSLQFSGGPPAQAPPAQVSLVVHMFPSLQGAELLAWKQPVSEPQKSSVQTFPSSQSGGGPPTHTPPEQKSGVVHALPSSHGLLLFTW